MTAHSSSYEHRLTRLLSSWRANPSVGGNIAAWQTEPARPPRLVPFPPDLAPGLVAALRRQGIRALYSHQGASWEKVHAGHHMVIVTGTASGKTLCYNLPILDHLQKDPQARALYLFPTKALAQDQVAGVRALVDGAAGSAIGIGVYDGDTPSDARFSIRSQARIVVSNPDMLHTGILPHHTLWADFFRHLRFVVIDEMHTYRGVFGSHVANVLRRTRRVARSYGAAPQFVLTSATIANPVELAERLTEESVVLVDEDGAAKGQRHFVIYNPPVVNRSLGLRKSALLESVRLAQELLTSEVQTIVFARARRTVELLVRYLGSETVSSRDETGARRQGAGVKEPEPAAPRSVRGYRSGYLPHHRREIERGLRDGTVRAVVATNALELGIDIGSMGAAVLVGYPGTIAATRQQAGRAGRQAESSLAILITTADPLDQFLARHPDYFYGRSPEQALINPDNLPILVQHLRCAAFELPFRLGEGFGKVEPQQTAELLDFLKEGGVLHRSADKYFWMADQYPAAGVSLRSVSADTVVLQSGDQSIGQVDLASASWMVHPEAVYLHEGQSYLVENLDLAHAPALAQLRPVQLDYYTEPRSETTVQLLTVQNQVAVSGGNKALGEIAVTTQVTGFRKVKWFTHENLGEGTVSLPPDELHTTGFWLGLSQATVEHLRDAGMWTNDANDYGADWPVQRDRALARDGFRCQSCGVRAAELTRGLHVHHKIPFRAFASPGQANQLENLATLCPDCHRRAEMAVRLRSGLAGLAHVLGHLAPFFLMCDSHDLGVHSDPQSPLADGQPAVVIYDQVPGGIGFSERLFEVWDGLIAQANELVAACECEDGCPSCVGPGGENGSGGKSETRALLEILAGREN